MSEKPGGGGDTDSGVNADMFACAYTMPVSGSAPAPGQLVPPLAFPRLSAPSNPLTLPTIGGLYSVPL